MKTRIIVDSTSDLLPQIKEQVHVVPLTVNFGDEEYIDGITIDHKAFYEKLAQSDTPPSTSQATPAAFSEEFEKAAQAGKSAVVITMASNLSGTYQSALIAASDYENIYVVENGSVAIGGGILVELALQLRDAGLSAKEIAQQLEEAKKKVCIVALLDTLEYLKRGGRISKTAAFAGALLNIKPVLSIIHGQINILGKARGSKQGNAMLDQVIENIGGIDFSKPILLGYAGLSDNLLLRYIEESKHIRKMESDNIRYTTIGSVIGAHAGPGTVAVAFFKK